MRSKPGTKAALCFSLFTVRAPIPNLKYRNLAGRLFTLFLTAIWVLILALPMSQTTCAEPAPKDSTQNVIAEGVGTTTNDALKDAYRNAVRHIVGAVVDAETLIASDEVISDKVLTYSDGFIKKYEEVGEVKRSKDGLYRIKIKAQVERRSVIAKLKAVSVTVKEIDGKSLFAEAITQSEAEKESTGLLKKAISDLPTLLKAELLAKPEFDRQTSEITLSVAIRPDLPAFTAFARRLEDLLKKISISRTSALMKGLPYDKGGKQLKDHYYSASSVELPWGPRIVGENTNAWCIWVCPSSTGSHTSLRWNGYVVDSDMGVVLQDLLMPSARSVFVDTTATRPSEAKTLVNLRLLSEDGSLVSEDEFEVLIDADQAFDNRYPSDGSARFPLLRHFVVRQLDGKSADLLNASRAGAVRFLEDRNRQKPNGHLSYYTGNLYIAPYAFILKQEYGIGSSEKAALIYATQQKHERRVKVTLEELRSIKDVECKVVWKSRLE